MASVFPIIRRGISTTAVVNGKRSFRKFNLFNKRGTKEFKERQRVNPDPDIPIHHRGVRKIGVEVDGRFEVIPEMVPELIVPNLKDCQLKPYVSYRSRVVQSEFTPRDLFDAVYRKKITLDYSADKLDEYGDPLEPNEHEAMTPEQALDLARKTGSDIFTHDKPGLFYEEVK